MHADMFLKRSCRVNSILRVYMWQQRKILQHNIWSLSSVLYLSKINVPDLTAYEFSMA